MTTTTATNETKTTASGTSVKPQMLGETPARKSNSPLVGSQPTSKLRAGYVQEAARVKDAKREACPARDCFQTPSKGNEAMTTTEKKSDAYEAGWIVGRYNGKPTTPINHPTATDYYNGYWEGQFDGGHIGRDEYEEGKAFPDDRTRAIENAVTRAKDIVSIEGWAPELFYRSNKFMSDWELTRNNLHVLVAEEFESMELTGDKTATSDEMVLAYSLFAK